MRVYEVINFIWQVSSSSLVFDCIILMMALHFVRPASLTELVIREKLQYRELYLRQYDTVTFLFHSAIH